MSGLEAWRRWRWRAPWESGTDDRFAGAELESGKSGHGHGDRLPEAGRADGRRDRYVGLDNGRLDRRLEQRPLHARERALAPRRARRRRHDPTPERGSGTTTAGSTAGTTPGRRARVRHRVSTGSPTARRRRQRTAAAREPSGGDQGKARARRRGGRLGQHGSTATPPAPASREAPPNAGKLRVESVKMLAATCPAPKHSLAQLVRHLRRTSSFPAPRSPPDAQTLPPSSTPSYARLGIVVHRGDDSDTLVRMRRRCVFPRRADYPDVTCRAGRVTD